MNRTDEVPAAYRCCFFPNAGGPSRKILGREKVPKVAFRKQFRASGGSAADDLLTEQAKKLKKTTIEVESIIFDFGW